MRRITTLFVRKVLAAVEAGIDKESFLHSLGIAHDSLKDPSHMLSDTVYYAFLEKLTTVDQNPMTLPLRAGAAMCCDDYGAFGFAWKSATNLQSSYERAERYARVLTNVSTYEVEKTDEGAFIHLHRVGERRLGMRLSNEATIASIASISQQVSTKAFNPIAVYFKHPSPKTITAHETYFGCPVYFQSDRDALLISSETLQTPNKLGDASISKFFDTHLETELSKLEDDSALNRQVRIQVSQALSEGVPMLSDIARRLGMSGRTLQRRLSDEGYSYQTLVDESRRQLAKHLLQQTDFSLADVAFMTGFSEQSAFTRAFKRWAGQTPRSYRIDSKSK
jgi:AraC-like DNA-binding protein